MQIRPTAFTIGLIIHFSIALFPVYTEFGIDSKKHYNKYKESEREWDKIEYGKRLNELREAKQLSIYKLSQDSGVSQGHISDLENGKYQPTIETLNKLLSPMVITLAEFFNENGDVSVLTDREKEVVASFRTMPEDKAELYLQLGKALNN